METGETEEEEEEDKKSERGSSGLSRHSASLGQRSARSRPQSSSSVKGQQIQSGKFNPMDTHQNALTIKKF